MYFCILTVFFFQKHQFIIYSPLFFQRFTAYIFIYFYQITEKLFFLLLVVVSFKRLDDQNL